MAFLVASGVIFPSLGTHAGVPSGYTRETNLDDKYPLGSPASTNPNVTGGAATHTHATSHTHTVGSHSHTGITSGTGGTSGSTNLGSGAVVGSSGHTHAFPTTGTQTATLQDSGSVVTGSGSSLPSSYGVIFIKSDGTPAGVPDGREALWAGGTAPSGWTVQSAPAGYYLVGSAAAADAGTTSGGATHLHAGAAHTHTISSHAHTIGNTDGPSSTVDNNTGAAARGSSTHTHTSTIQSAASSASGSQTSGNSGSTNVAPAYYKLGVIRNGTGAAAVVTGIIGAWLGTLASIPTGWALCDGTNGTPDLRDKMIIAAASNLSDVGGTGGATSHDHTDPTGHTHTTSHTHTIDTSGGPSATTNQDTGALGTASSSHTHSGGASGSGGPTSGSGTEAIANATAYPPYRTVAWIQLQSFAQTATPSAVAIPVAIPDPVVLLPYTATPTPVAIPIEMPDPTAVLAYTATPAAVPVPIEMPDPFLIGTELTVTPDAVAVPIEMPDPTLAFGEVAVAPDPVAVPVAAVAPTITYIYTALPDAVPVPIAPPTPTLLHGEVTLAPDPVAVPIAPAVPTLQIVFTVTPNPVVITIALPDGTLGNFLGIVPVELPPPTAEEVHEALSGLYGDVSLRFRYSRRTRTNALIDEIEGVPAGGAVTLDNARAVVRDLEIELDLDQLPADFSLTGDILAVVVEVYVPQAQQWAPLQVGLFTLDAAETHYALGGSLSRLVPVRGADLAMLLVQSVRTATYELPAGTHVIDAVEAILDRHGFSHSLPATISDTLPAAVSWPAGTSEWQICADLMFGVNCFPPTPDAQGVFRSRSRIDPSTETAAVIYRNTAEPMMVSANDRYIVGRDTKLPNRVRVVIDDPRNAGFGAVERENTDADSPTSTAALVYGDEVSVSASSIADPTVITTAAAHGFADGVQVLITGHEGSTPDINGSHVVTVLSTTAFSIPVAVTVAGTGGTVQATSVQLLEFKGDSTPSTIAVIDATRAGEVADYETRWAALQSEPVEIGTFMDPRRSEREYVELDLDGIEDAELFAVLGWNLELRPGAVMQHRLGRARSITVQEPA